MTKKIKDGFQINYNENGDKKSEGNYKNNEKDGKWIKWNERGNKISETVYKKGKKDGQYTEYWNPSSGGKYRNDKKYGKWKEISGGGGVRYIEEGKYKDGLRDGIWTISRFSHIGPFRYVEEGEYKKGLKDGKWIQWYDKDKKIKKEETLFRNGKENGEYKEWYESGYDKTQGNYKNGLREGVWFEWYLIEYDERLDEMKKGWENTGYIEGKKRLETKYIDGKKIGDSVEHDEGDQTVYEDDY